MRIATWNCLGGLDSKTDVIDSLAADILVIQECSKSSPGRAAQ